MTFPETDVLNAIVARVFRIDDVTHGDPQSGFLFRYRGHLLTEDSAAAYDSLSKALEHYKLVPLFREEDGQQIIVLVPAAAKPKPSRISVNIVLFILTLLSVLFAGVMYSYQGPLPEDPLEQILTLISNIWQGWPFAVSLLSILLAHEFGHYFMGRRHHTNVSLPYFIPFPTSFLGTMGAFINMKERPRNKRILMDIGIAGPLAGLIIAIPVLMLGIYLSDTSTLSNTIYPYRENQALACQAPTIIGDTYTCPNDNLLEGNSLLYLGLKALGKGQLLPSPPSMEGSPVVYWLRFFFTGSPLPFGGKDISLHPVAMAGWAGILVTFLNLIPAGQLDGGHVMYAIFGRKARKYLWIVLIPMILLGAIWSGWWLWAGLIYFLGRTQAEPLDQITELDPRRKKLAVLMLFIFILVFTPVPFVVF
ncbi:site-2 protease family protein [Chloroflexota bacterium]